MKTRAVLFDLDGTLADTAPDLGAAVNALRCERGLAELPIAQLRAYASSGARGMLKVGLSLAPGDDGYEAARDAFLERYGERVCVETKLFPGMRELIGEIEVRDLAWGIVTNKAMRFTKELVKALALKPDCVVGGDSTPHIKPHPGPLLRAAELLKLASGDCLYVGDDLRDVQAARSAGMRVVAVEYGYSAVNDGGPRSWKPDAVIAQPLDLIEWL